MLETDQPYACFWTYFGFESDLIDLLGKSLTISSRGWNTTINLGELNK